MDYAKLIARAKRVSRELKSAAAARFLRACKRHLAFKVMREGLHARDLVVVAVPSGDPGFYQELSISVHDKEGKNIADLLVGLSPAGEVRILSTSGGDGDGDKSVALFPERAREKAVEDFQ